MIFNSFKGKHFFIVVLILSHSNITKSATNAWWKPSPGSRMHIQYQGSIKTSSSIKVYNVDLFESSQKFIDDRHKENKKVICYFSAGTYEDWRPDKNQFPSYVKGKNLEDWPGEKWLDVRRVDVLKPIMQKRLDLAVSKKCDAVDPDNVDGYANNSGFSIKSSDQLIYNKMLAEEAHKRNLAIGLKNDLDQVKALEPYFDFAINEECFSYNECSVLKTFIGKKKPVWGMEYELSTKKFCKNANKYNFDFQRKHYELDSWSQYCR